MREALEARGVQVVFILCQNAARVEAWLRAHPQPFPLLVDADRRAAKTYGVWHPLGLAALNIARPALFLIGTDGRIRWAHVSRHQRDLPDPETLPSLIDRALKEG
ncbi:MAG: peroxiredoxin family protein [Candidatus Rokubacteria bacterium]|nr:peroxiredoxin family protein [Candidatus Rokubacteria bacterium]